MPGVNVNYADREYWTAVHWAAAWCENSLAEFVGKSDVNWNSLSKDLYTPLHISIYYGRPGATKIILRIPKVDIRRPNHKGYSPLETAVTMRGTEYNLDCLKHIVEFEA